MLYAAASTMVDNGLQQHVAEATAGLVDRGHIGDAAVVVLELLAQQRLDCLLAVS